MVSAWAAISTSQSNSFGSAVGIPALRACAQSFAASPQRTVGESQVAIRPHCVEGIELCEPFSVSHPLQLAPDLVVGNRRNNKTVSRRHQVESPERSRAGLWGFLWISQQSQWPRVENDHATHG